MKLWTSSRSRFSGEKCSCFSSVFYFFPVENCRENSFRFPEADTVPGVNFTSRFNLATFFMSNIYWMRNRKTKKVGEVEREKSKLKFRKIAARDGNEIVIIAQEQKSQRKVISQNGFSCNETVQTVGNFWKHFSHDYVMNTPHFSRKCLAFFFSSSSLVSLKRWRLFHIPDYKALWWSRQTCNQQFFRIALTSCLVKTRTQDFYPLLFSKNIGIALRLARSRPVF